LSFLQPFNHPSLKDLDLYKAIMNFNIAKCHWLYQKDRIKADWNDLPNI
jgi:hypothetical protein